jgi:hypothetical protein
MGSNIEIIKGNPDPDAHYLMQLSWLESVSESDGPPPHLYFLAHGEAVIDEDQEQKFVSKLNWPFTLPFGGQLYYLMSRGY